MAILDSILGGNTLYYPGCLIKAVLPKVSEAYRTLLRRAGIDFIELTEKELCCGSPLINAGFKKESEKVASDNLSIFATHGIKRIITPCPACAYTFTDEYKKQLGDKWNIKVEHATDTLLVAAQKGKLKLRKIYDTATYHDPCYLSRYQQSTEAPRALIKLISHKYKDMQNSGKDTFCCGGGGGVRATNPKQAELVGQARIRMALETGAEVVINTCPMCYVQLKKHAADKIRITEISESLIEALK